MQHKISVELKAHVGQTGEVIGIYGVSETCVTMSGAGMHARQLRLRDKDKVRLTLERVRK